MKTALFIGGSCPEKAVRLTFDYPRVTVICTSEDQRRRNWSFRAYEGVEVIVADPMAIRTEVQTNFHHTFDHVVLDVYTPVLAQKAQDFVKPNGKVVPA